MIKQNDPHLRGLGRVLDDFAPETKPAERAEILATFKHEFLNDKWAKIQTAAESNESLASHRGWTLIEASDHSIHRVPSNRMDAARELDPGLTVVGAQESRKHNARKIRIRDSSGGIHELPETSLNFARKRDPKLRVIEDEQPTHRYHNGKIEKI